MNLITLMTPKLTMNVCIVKRAPDDTDTVIVSSALQLAQNGSTVTVFASDTDVIIMLLYFWNS